MFKITNEEITKQLLEILFAQFPEEFSNAKKGHNNSIKLSFSNLSED